MRILYHHRTRSRDGQAVHIEEVIAALRALGHEVTVVSPDRGKQRPFGADAGSVGNLKQLIPRWGYEILELAYSVIPLVRLGRAYLKHRPDVIYERYNLYLLSGLLLARITGLPLLLEVNAPLADERDRFGGLGLPWLARWCERTVWRGADRCLPVTRALAGYLRQAAVAESRITVIANGVGSEWLDTVNDGAEIRGRYRLIGRTVLGFAGFVRDWHGLDRVIEMLAEADNPQLHLLVVGDGPAVPQLSMLAERLGVREHVTFTGLVERHAMPAHVAAFDIAMQPAVVPYASPLKLFEYMAMAKAIVAPAMDNIREVLTDGEDALLFEPDEKMALTRTLMRLVEDEPLRTRLGCAARATLERRNLTWRGNAQRILALAQEVIDADR